MAKAAGRQEPHGGVVVGVDIGGTKTALLATDVQTGDDLADATFETPADDGPEAMVDQLEAAIAGLLGQAERRPADLAGVGIAVPGLVDVGAGRVLLAGNLHGWVDLPLRDIVRDRLAVPVFVDQDANAAALGEKWRGAAKAINNFVFLALGTGVGAGVVVNGRLHRGFHHAAGELGNLVVARNDLDRDRDGQGSLAARIGSRALRERIAEAVGEEMGVADAIVAARDDPRLAPIVGTVAAHVAMAVVAVAAVLDPEAVVLGGGTAEAGEALLGPVRSRVERELPAPPLVIGSGLGTQAQVHGAVFGALWELDPEMALREELR